MLRTGGIWRHPLPLAPADQAGWSPPLAMVAALGEELKMSAFNPNTIGGDIGATFRARLSGMP